MADFKARLRPTPEPFEEQQLAAEIRYQAHERTRRTLSVVMTAVRARQVMRARGRCERRRALETRGAAVIRRNADGRGPPTRIHLARMELVISIRT